MKDESTMLLGQTPVPLPDGSTPVEKLLLWSLAIAVGIISYFYRALETKNGKQIEELRETISELKHDLKACKEEHEKANDKFNEMRYELNEIQKARYKTQ